MNDELLRVMELYLRFFSKILPIISIRAFLFLNKNVIMDKNKLEISHQK
jgi:hypothetical protein